MDRRHSVSSLPRSAGAPDARAPWDKAAATRRPQLAQLPTGPSSAPKPLQDVSENQRSTPSQPLRRTSSGVRLAAKRVTRVPTLAFQTSGKRRGRHAISNQWGLDGADGAARQVNAGVYLLENAKTGHRYFATTWDLRNAAAQNFHDLQLGVHPHLALATCFQLYGEAASGICFRVLEHVSPPSSPKPPSHGDPIRTKRRRIKRLAAGGDEDDGFDVRAMERKLAARLRFHQRKVIRRAAYRIVRRFLVLPVLARAWPRWIRATEGCVCAEHVAAALDIQRAARGRLARVAVAGIRRDRAARTLQRFMRRSHLTLACRRRGRRLRESKAACVIQRSTRDFVARRRSRRRRDGVRRWLAARKLQACVRGYQARGLVRRMRLERARLSAAIDVQRVTRGHLGRLRVRRMRLRLLGTGAATLIQKSWRGYSARARVKLQRLGGALSLPGHRLRQSSLDELRDDAARTIQQAYRSWSARRLHEQNEKAATIRMAYRNYVARKFGWAVTTLLLETSMAKRIQRAGRRMLFQRGFRRVVRQFRRDKAALAIQCLTRQRQARGRVHMLRAKKRTAEAIRRIQSFWRACWMLLKLHERITSRKRERAARQIQAAYRAWRARREYLAIRDLARRNRAATKLQCMFRARQARRECMRRQVVRRLGACENCRAQLATVYHFVAESELCAACCADLASLDDSPMETIEVSVYRRLQVPLVSAQRAYRAFQGRMRQQFGVCTLCEKLAVRRSCWSCLKAHGKGRGRPEVGLTFCRTCDELFHERRQSTAASALLQHQRKDIERACAEDAAAVTIQTYYRRFAQRHTIAELRLARLTAAARRVQECYRRHRQRRVTRAICAAHRQQQLLEASAALTIQRAARGFLARCELRRLKLERDSAIKIQRAVRRYHARRVYDAAAMIQRNVRGWLARRVAAALRQERLEKQQSAAACCIQRHVRGFLARRRVLHIRQHNAAVLMQSIWRGYVAMCELRTLRLEKLRRFNAELRGRLNALAAQIAETQRLAATRLQKMVRGRQARDELQSRKLQAARTAREELRNSAVALEVASASCIQRHVRERLTNTASCQRLRAQCCARCFLSRRVVRRVRLEKQSAVRIQRAFRYSRAKRRLARLVDADGAEDAAAQPASGWVELFDEASGYVYYYHTETGESVWERPPEMDAQAWTPELPADQNVGEWVEYWDENVGASYFYNVKTGEATWTTPAEYQASMSNQADTATAEAWPLETGGAYYTLPPRSKLEQAPDAGNQHADQYDAPYGYEDAGEQAAPWGNNGYYYGDAAYPLEQADSDANQQYDPVDTEYDINYKIYLTQIERERQEQEDQQDADAQAPPDQQEHKANEAK